MKTMVYSILIGVMLMSMFEIIDDNVPNGLWYHIHLYSPF